MESICQLSAGSSEFASCCLDFLVDMFNDEIEAVRYVLFRGGGSPLLNCKAQFNFCRRKPLQFSYKSPHKLPFTSVRIL